MLLLAEGLPKDQFDVRFLLLSDPGQLAAEARALGLPVHVLGLSRETCRGFGWRCLRNAAVALRAYRRLTRDVDIVDAWLVPAYTFAGLVRPLASIPVLVAGRRNAFDVTRTRTWYREVAGKLAMRAVDAVVANSQAGADDAVRIEGIDPRRVHVIRNAVTPVAMSDADRLERRSAWGFSASDLVVGCVGNFKPGKGHSMLLDAAASLHGDLPGLRWCFVGDGPLRPELERTIRARGLARVVTLHSGERDARSLYGAFDIAVQASDSEGLPNAVLEAAVTGLPIVATAVGGTGEIVTDGVDGLLVHQSDTSALTMAVRRMADDADLRRRLGDAARVRAQDFSPSKLVEETGALYLRLVRSARTSR
jgi:glycosyltransferase involved in cell wall biosynthesis